MANEARRGTQMRSKSESTKGHAYKTVKKASKVKVTKTTAPTARKRPTARKASPAAKPKVVFSVVLKDVLSTVPAAARDGFVRVVVGDSKDELDTALWGSGPSPAERKEAALGNLRRQYESRRQVVDGSLTRTEVSELLDVSEQAVLDRLEAGDLIGLKKGREWRLPAWQFSADAERGFVPGLAQLRAAFPGGPVSMTEWATVPNVELEGATPADELAAGRVETVVQIAARGTAAAW